MPDIYYKVANAYPLLPLVLPKHLAPTTSQTTLYPGTHQIGDAEAKEEAQPTLECWTDAYPSLPSQKKVLLHNSLLKFSQELIEICSKRPCLEASNCQPTWDTHYVASIAKIDFNEDSILVLIQRADYEKIDTPSDSTENETVANTTTIELEVPTENFEPTESTQESDGTLASTAAIELEASTAPLESTGLSQEQTQKRSDNINELEMCKRLVSNITLRLLANLIQTSSPQTKSLENPDKAFTELLNDIEKNVGLYYDARTNVLQRSTIGKCLVSGMFSTENISGSNKVREFLICYFRTHKRDAYIEQRTQELRSYNINPYPSDRYPAFQTPENEHLTLSTPLLSKQLPPAVSFDRISLPTETVHLLSIDDDIGKKKLWPIKNPQDLLELIQFTSKKTCTTLVNTISWLDNNLTRTEYCSRYSRAPAGIAAISGIPFCGVLAIFSLVNLLRKIPAFSYNKEMLEDWRTGKDDINKTINYIMKDVLLNPIEYLPNLDSRTTNTLMQSTTQATQNMALMSNLTNQLTYLVGQLQTFIHEAQVSIIRNPYLNDYHPSNDGHSFTLFASNAEKVQSDSSWIASMALTVANTLNNLPQNFFDTLANCNVGNGTIRASDLSESLHSIGSSITESTLPAIEEEFFDFIDSQEIQAYTLGTINSILAILICLSIIKSFINFYETHHRPQYSD